MDESSKASGPGPQNPDWQRDELILALDLYFQYYPKLPSSNTRSGVEELSVLLNQLPIIPMVQRNEKFRNPSGVNMKLANFRFIDPSLPGGASKVGQGDREVWAEFQDDRGHLRDLANAIRRNMNEPAAIADAEDLDFEAAEGTLLLRLHHSRERNRKIIEERKRHALKSLGRLQCEACGFDFRESYGEVGDGFIECHHQIPVADLQPGQKTKIKDLALLCANCHRMIHRAKPMMTVEQLRVVAINMSGASRNGMTD